MFLFIALSGCASGTLLPAPKGDVVFELVSLGYFQSGPDEVISDETAWEDFGAGLGGDTGSFDGELPEVDFATQAVAVHAWVDGGCTDDPAYWGWHRDGVAEMHTRAGRDGGCEAWFPQVDLLIVELEDSSSLAWIAE